VFNPPSPLEETFDYGDNLLSQPHCGIVTPGPRHWAIFKRPCVEADARGPLVADAWFAALAIERGCTWITFDRDYARFPGLEWRTPDA
jgi:predicted nucleic acid-binding protein